MKIKISVFVLSFLLCVNIAWAGEASETASQASQATTSLVGTIKLTADKKGNPWQAEIISKIDLSKDSIYDGTLSWLAETFVSSKEVIELKDKDLGKIIGNGTVSINIDRLNFIPVYSDYGFTMKIDIKDKKYRITFSNVVCYTEQYGKIAVSSDSDPFIEDRLSKKFTELATSLQDYLTKNPKNSDF